jgi:hypothetical protein
MPLAQAAHTHHVTAMVSKTPPYEFDTTRPRQPASAARGPIIDQDGHEVRPETLGPGLHGFRFDFGQSSANPFANLTREQRLVRLEALAQLLDVAFIVPGTKIRYGIDGLIGLIPVIGDIITTAISLWLVRELASCRLSAMPSTSCSGPMSAMSKCCGNGSTNSPDSNGEPGPGSALGCVGVVGRRLNHRRTALERKVLALIQRANAALVEARFIDLQIGAVQRIRRQLFDGELHRSGSRIETAIGETGTLLLADCSGEQFCGGVVAESCHGRGPHQIRNETTLHSHCSRTAAGGTSFQDRPQYKHVSANCDTRDTA